jgi:hypothetical protein
MGGLCRAPPLPIGKARAPTRKRPRIRNALGSCLGHFLNGSKTQMPEKNLISHRGIFVQLIPAKNLYV